MANKEKLIECLAKLTEEELVLTMATGLNCEYCPMAHEKGERCYDKTVCCKNLTAWIKGAVITMEVNDKIEEMAHEEAFKHYFCNVGESDWPDDPDAFIEKVVWQSEEDECDAAELSYEDENGKCMDIWAPFEMYSISDMRELMADFETALINFYKEAKKLDTEE